MICTAVAASRCGVPSVPCGVESSMALRQSEIKDLFLMYRVELKEFSLLST